MEVFELKPPNRAMVGARASPNNRPVRTAPSRVTDRPVLRRTSFWSARLSGFGLEKGTNRWHNARPAPGSRPRATSHRRGGRHPARLPQDGLRWAKEGKLPSSRPSAWAPPLPRGEDPRARQRPAGGAHRVKPRGRGTPRGAPAPTLLPGGQSAHVVHGTVLASWAVPSSRRNGPGPRTRCCTSRTGRPAITVP